MSARLVPLNPALLPPIVLQRPIILVGRHPECDVRIDRPEVSDRHCCLAQAEQRLIVRDLGSRNGVRVNGRLVEEAVLSPLDEVALGPIVFRVEGGVPAPRPSPASSPLPASPQASEARPPGQSQIKSLNVTSIPPQPREESEGGGNGHSGKRKRNKPPSLPDLPIAGGDSELVPIDDI